MSRRTRAVAVAVNPCRLTPGKRERSAPIWRYSGRKSWPHWLIQPASHERRHLEAQRLAAAGRQDDDRVAAVENRRHRFALQRTERGVAPVLGERLLEGDHGRWRSRRRRRRRRIRDGDIGGYGGN